MNFALILFLIVVATGILWAIDHFWTRKKRPEGAKEPWWVEYGASFFPVILAVFVLRSFLVEPFKIPSGSMMPTLLVGDFILVNKFTYGIRLPVLNKKIVELGSPQRGDVVVFRYPPQPSLDYIKRVVGLPGDRVDYRNKRLFINGQEVMEKRAGDFLDRDRLYYTPHFIETLGTVEHSVLIDAEAPGYVQPIVHFPHVDNCHYNSGGVSCVVPPGNYFMMGDNRDNSQDSRFWGFVPNENLVGKAFLIWFNFSDLKRVGSFH
ncbi:MAG: signal peptidase I [Betaproteobacteria bacterium HGW-Betaproteobacteria-11]|nr:MAG: signal peptidase I [Betaproteobacteria bacterium HGW-Betaproteobacteria-11]